MDREKYAETRELEELMERSFQKIIDLGMNFGDNGGTTRADFRKAVEVFCIRKRKYEESFNDISRSN